ncbi:TonB-dependent receptor [Brevundimonas goettingensis]|uniref:TonB-dependent receptor n=1 Tax=Brevundimonas goettingensis TaxID=2774190 RepID=A0A975BZA7_9CAUL|nr:TonB-dependent receptor [Brevundimonas goettingensis]QTC90768.1 TonB-dependent receptor [Brevundimonas goettingensis]
MFRSLLLASCCAFAVSAPAFAQTSQDTTELEEVIVTGSQVTLTAPYAGGQVARGSRVGLFGSLGVMDTPFATTSYTEELSRNQQTRSVGDVLQNDPAVRVSKGFGNFQELYVIRGFPVYSDDMTYNGLYGILPRQFVASEFLERVEVFHGATAFLNGAAPGGSGVGGAFNLTPKRAGNEPLTRVTAGIESGGEIYLAGDVARRFGVDQEYGARLNLVRRDGESTVDGEDRQLTAIGLGLDRRGERARFSADVGYQDHHIDAPRPTVTPSGAVPAAPSADVNYAQPWTYTDEQQVFGAARGEFDVTDSVTAWAAFGGRQGKEANVLANPNVDAGGNLTAYRFDNTREDTVWSGDVGLRADLTTGSVGHRIVASASQVQSKSKNAYAFSSFAGFPAGTLSNPVAATQPAANFFIGGDLDSPLVTERVDNSSLAIADMLSFLDGRLLVTAGVRYQNIKTRTYDYNTGALGSSYDGDAVTPAFAVVFKPIDRVSLYANYAEALIPGKIAPAVVNGLNVTNAGEVLDPFVGEQFEVGAKYDAGTFGGSISLFRTTLQSELFTQTSATAGTYSSGGEQENSGVELSVYGEPIAGLRLLGGMSWLDAEIASSGRTPIGVPDFQANANIEWDVPQVAGLTLEGRAVYTGEQETNATTSVPLDAWTRFDAGVRYAFEAGGHPLTARARVENIADEDQWVAVGGYPGANYLTLGAPRTLRVSISADF